ncbi:MAG: hypothetical protein K0R51_3084 [Cytophagaceae bacterium]|jgi:integral membrane protein|nr:hypothetical protein [Cytophagaceae bacterium]
METKTPNKALILLRIIGWLEGLSLIALIGIAMPLKYIYNKPEATKEVGMAHGVLFILYSLLLFGVAYQLKWSIKRTALGFIASFIPFGTFWAEFKLFRDDSSSSL